MSTGCGAECAAPYVGTGKCGQQYGGITALCDRCETALARQYPWGWRYVPGDTCCHGVYVGGLDADYMCPACENGDRLTPRQYRWQSFCENLKYRLTHYAAPCEVHYGRDHDHVYKRFYAYRHHGYYGVFVLGRYLTWETCWRALPRLPRIRINRYQRKTAPFTWHLWSPALKIIGFGPLVMVIERRRA